MTQTIHPLALFRLSVLGPLASRDRLSRGELQSIIKELSSKTYTIPHSRRTHLSPQVIERWYYAWRRSGIDGLAPKPIFGHLPLKTAQKPRKWQVFKNIILLNQ